MTLEYEWPLMFRYYEFRFKTYISELDLKSYTAAAAISSINEHLNGTECTIIEKMSLLMCFRTQIYLPNILSLL